MRDPRQVVLRPLVTEKATTLKDERNQVSFQVALDALAADGDVQVAETKAFGCGVKWSKKTM